MAKVNELQVDRANDLMNLKTRVASDTQLEAKGPLLDSADPHHFKGENHPTKSGNDDSFVGKRGETASEMKAYVTMKRCTGRDVRDTEVDRANDILNLKTRATSDTQQEAKGPLLVSEDHQYFKGENRTTNRGNEESFVAKEVEIASDIEAFGTVTERDVRDTEVYGPGLHAEEGRTGDMVSRSGLHTGLRQRRREVNSSSTLQLPKSVSKVKEMLGETALKETFARRTQREQESNGIPPNELRLVIIGKSGSGKSSTANTIIGKDFFKTGASATGITKETETYRVSRFSKEIVLVDTPGFFDPEIEKKETEKEISRCMYMTLPGFHAFLLVVRIGRFTAEEMNTVEEFEKLFGEKLYDFMVIVFTQMDALIREKKTLDYFVRNDIPPNLKEIIERCNHRYVGFNNIGNQKSKKNNTRKVLGMIEKMIGSKDPNHYTNDAFKKAEKELCETIEAVTERTKAAKEADFEEMFAEREKKMREEHATNMKEMKEKYAKLLADQEKISLELKKSLDDERELRQKKPEKDKEKKNEPNGTLIREERYRLKAELDYLKKILDDEREFGQKKPEKDKEKKNEPNGTLIREETFRLKADLENQKAKAARDELKRDKSAWYRFGKWIGFWKE